MSKIIIVMMVMLFSTWIITSAYTEFAGDQIGIKSEDDVSIGAYSLSGDSGREEMQLSTSDIGIIAESASLPKNIEFGEIVTLYGGERILKIPRNDLNDFKSEAQKRLGKSEEFGKYLFQSQANGVVAVYLDTNEKISIIDQNDEAVLSFLISNPEEMEKGAGEYPQNKLLTSKDKIFFDNVVDEVFNIKDSTVYIPQDTNSNDNEPVPKVIVQKETGVAVQHIRISGLDYLAIGFGPFAYDNIQEIMNRNGVFGSSGSQVQLINNMEDGPIAPIPEMNTFALMTVGLIGLFVIFGLWERR